MDYKKLIEDIYNHRFRLQTKNSIIKQVLEFELFAYENYKKTSNCPENIKYKHIFFEFKKELVDGVFTNNKISYIQIRKIINKLRNNYENIIFETGEEILCKKLKEIAECGLSLSEDSDEKKYLSLIDKEIKDFCSL